MEGRSGRSRSRDRGDLLLGELNYCIFCQLRVLHPPLLGSPFKKKGGCVLEDPTRLWIGEVLLYLLEVYNYGSPEPVLADALPYLSYSDFIRNVI